VPDAAFGGVCVDRSIFEGVDPSAIFFTAKENFLFGPHAGWGGKFRNQGHAG
jgi:hypothetical protein